LVYKFVNTRTARNLSLLEGVDAHWPYLFTSLQGIDLRLEILTDAAEAGLSDAMRTL